MSRQSVAESLGPLLDRFRAGDRRALARLITHVDNGAQVEQILEQTKEPSRTALKVGITGPGAPARAPSRRRW